MFDDSSAVDIVIEFPCEGDTYRYEEFGVYAYDQYPEGSVLEGQDRRRFLGMYPSLAEAQHAYPYAADGTGDRGE